MAHARIKFLRHFKVHFLASVLLVFVFILYYLGMFVTGPGTNIMNVVYDFRFYISDDSSEDILRLQNVAKKKTYTIDTMDYRQSVYIKYYKKRKHSSDIDCDGIINGDAKSINHTKRILHQKSKHKGISVDFYTNIANCDNFKKQRGYLDHPLSPEEREFPLAFGIIVYKDVEQAERLLRAIYRPHNYYCFHVDKTTNNKTRLAFQAIASCFDNVFLVPNPVDVRWATITVLQAELLCMHYLWSAKKWKYYINLTGQEFPLKTNLEIVKILRAMNGANIAQAMKDRTMTEFRERWEPFGPVPHNIQPIVGSVHAALNRDFVDFCIHDNRSFDFQKYLLNTFSPDELFFSSINHNPHLKIPGTFIGEAEEYPKKPFFLRYKNWDTKSGIYPRKCYGKFHRNICILGMGDIYKAVNDIGLFANKFHSDFEPAGLDCLESWLNERTWEQYLSNKTIDVSYYKELDQVKFQYRPNEDYDAKYS